ncbi:unannotated protein [freshwater metagenome]|uniref:Unannotated protein n=1 Tax=freshwater metagenome TaxID=449393 RepID=A0A6J7IEN6_9ZZZZ
MNRSKVSTWIRRPSRLFLLSGESGLRNSPDSIFSRSQTRCSFSEMCSTS